MLPTVIYLVRAVRRALRKTGRGLFIVADSVNQALEQGHDVRRRYPAAE